MSSATAGAVRRPRSRTGRVRHRGTLSAHRRLLVRSESSVWRRRRSTFSISRAVMTLNAFAPPRSQATGLRRSATRADVAAATVERRRSPPRTAGGGRVPGVVTADGQDVGSAVVPDSSGRCVRSIRGRCARSSGRGRVRSTSRSTVSRLHAALPEGSPSIGVVLETGRATGRRWRLLRADGRAPRYADRRRRRGRQARRGATRSRPRSPSGGRR